MLAALRHRLLNAQLGEPVQSRKGSDDAQLKISAVLGILGEPTFLSQKGRMRQEALKVLLRKPGEAPLAEIQPALSFEKQGFRRFLEESRIQLIPCQYCALARRLEDRLRLFGNDCRWQSPFLT